MRDRAVHDGAVRPVGARRFGARDLRVSLGALRAEVLEARLRMLDEAGCRVELRLDLLPADADLRRLARSFPRLDLLAAWPTAPAAVPAARRIAALREAAEAGLPWLDVPLELADADLPAGRRTWSWHGTPTDGPQALPRAWDAVRAVAGAEDVCKLVSWADGAEQAFTTLEQARGFGDARLLCFSMGPGGEASRLLALRDGAPWAYVAWPGAPTAAGQIAWDAALELLPARDAGPLCGVVGDPVGHSLSPQLWQAAWRAADLDGWFLRFRTRHFATFLERATAYGLELLAVTAPHKEAALAAAGVADASARRCGAANLLLRQDGGWRAASSDGSGALDALQAAGLPAQAPVLVLGAGGAARAAADEALRRGHPVRVAARRAEAQLEVARRLDRRGALTTCALPLGDEVLADLLRSSGTPAGAIVQATPVGSAAQPGDLLAGRRIPPGVRVLDMVYAPPHTALLAHAEADGAVAVPGVAMLLHQMCVQYALQHGAPPPIAVPRARLEAEARRRAGIALIGMRGAGKSTLGRWLAEVLGLPFVDADEAYAARHGATVGEALAGDASAFRAREATLFVELLAAQEAAGGGVLASGGGVVLDKAARALLEVHPGTVLLEVSAETLATRQAAAPRPRLQAAGSLLDETRAVQAERAEAYAACARRRLATDGDLATARARLLAVAEAAGYAGFRP